MSRRYLLIAATAAAAREARVSADALAACDPDVPRTIVVLDEDPRSLEVIGAAGDVVTGAQLGLDLDLVGRWAGAYGEGCLMWAAFPHILAAVGSPGEQVLWLGTDLEVVASPEAIWAAIAEAPVVAGVAAPSLAPHENDRPDASNGRPYGLQPITAVVRRSGELVSRSMLGWQVDAPVLKERLAHWPVPRDRPTHEPTASAVSAQQWFTALALGPGVAMVEDAGVVLSAAQLLSRTVGADADGCATVDGSPLSLLALRGFDPLQPHLLESSMLTVRVSDRPALAPTLRRRAERLLAAGWTADAPESRWHQLPEGLAITPLVTDLIRAGLRAGAITRSPFSPEGYAEFSAYVTQPARSGGSIGVNRLLGAVHSSRVDLHAAYPALDGPDGLGFLGWAWVHGRDEMQIPESLLPPRPAFLDAAPADDEVRRGPDTEGVNLAGYFTSELGLGESARQIASALGAAGVSTTPVQGLLVPPTRQQAEFQPVGPKDAHHDVNVVVVNGDQMPGFARDVGAGFFEGRPTIGVWWWEVDPFPADEWATALEWVDEVWVGTEFIRGLVEPHIDVPVWVFPVPVAVSEPDVPLPRDHFGFGEDETVFLYVWDYHSTEARKNPSGLVEAYRRAFPDPATSNTRLVLKCINHENLPELDEKVRLAAAGRDDIQFIDRFLSGREKNGLLALCDCYVSPHRSEGFGYTPAEAMLLGKPVVVTAYGGTTEYTDDTVARMVRWTPTDVGPGAAPYPSHGRWADPDLDDLADALRWIVEEPEAAAAMAVRGRERVAANHNLETSGRAMRDRLAIVRDRAPRDQPAPQSAPPSAGSGASVGGMGKADVKRLAKRALKQAPGATSARAKWWRVQDRSVAARTADIRRDHAALAAATDERFRELSDRLLKSADQQTDALRELGASVEVVAAHTADQDGRFETIEGGVRDTQAAVQQTGQELGQRLDDHLVRHSVEPYGIREAGFSIQEVEGIGKALGGTDLASTGDNYADFLSVFRGPYERVLELMEVYGPILAGHGPLLDIGCGRGELLEVAERAGVDGVRGIDLDVELVAQAEQRGRTAEVGDGIAALRDLPDAALGAVTAIHVLEHLDAETLEAFFRQTVRTLEPGGIVVIETINPHEVSAAATFWVDPTHHGPLFPEVALALALSAGFSSAHVFAPDGTGDWDHDRTRSTRYALLARAPK